MAIKGLSKPICGEYAAAAGVVTYSKPYAADHAVEYSFEAETGEDNDLYADNQVQETASGKFSSGTLTLQTADIEPLLAAKILGLKKVTRTIEGKEISEVVYDDDQKAPDLGFGIIEEHQINGITTYLPIVFTKIRFNIPGNAATTRGDTVDWQTREITAKVMRSEQVDENYNHPWQISPETPFKTEAEAERYIKAVLGEIENQTPANVGE